MIDMIMNNMVFLIIGLVGCNIIFGAICFILRDKIFELMEKKYKKIKR